MQYQDVLEKAVSLCRETFGKELTGVYLHGSLAMGCFCPAKSDIDLIVVVEGDILDSQKFAFLERIVELNGQAPKKGIELSVVKREFCKDFVYPTPYEFHFSVGHLEQIHQDPVEYVRTMKGTDKDLAAHFTIINHFGITLWGLSVEEVFSPVPGEYYEDSILYDMENAEEDMLENPLYVTLNLCRVLAYLREGLVLSKRQGGQWGLQNLPERFGGILSDALACYGSDRIMEPDQEAVMLFCRYMRAEMERFSV